LRTLIVTLGLSAICVTHDQVEAMAIADRITLLNAGLVEQEGTPTALYSDPKSQFAAEFMGSNNALAGTLAAKSDGRAILEVAGHRLEGLARTSAAAGEAATGVIRLEQVRVADAPGANRIPMTLKTQMYLGERWELVLARDSLMVRAFATGPLAEGEHQVEFPAPALRVF